MATEKEIADREDRLRRRDYSRGNLADSLRSSLRDLEVEVQKISAKDPAVEGVKAKLAAVRRDADHLEWQPLPDPDGNPEAERIAEERRRAGFQPAPAANSDLTGVYAPGPLGSVADETLRSGETNPAKAPPPPEPRTVSRDARHDGEPAPSVPTESANPFAPATQTKKPAK